MHKHPSQSRGKKQHGLSDYGPLVGSGLKEQVLPIAIDKNGKERISFVQKENYSAYTHYHNDPFFISKLPDFHLPMLGVGSFRAFEIADDSMAPLEPGSIVVGEYLCQLNNFDFGKTYVMLHEERGLLYKRIFKGKQKGLLKLVSENAAYSPYEISFSKLSEIWQARMFIGS